MVDQFDFTRTQMVLTMKLTSFAYDLYDGSYPEEQAIKEDESSKGIKNAIMDMIITNTMRKKETKIKTKIMIRIMAKIMIIATPIIISRVAVCTLNV
jgi:hypothetical protein